jgi:hypothetical protein
VDERENGIMFCLGARKTREKEKNSSFSLGCGMLRNFPRKATKAVFGLPGSVVRKYSIWFQKYFLLTVKTITFLALLYYIHTICASLFATLPALIGF